jgi:small subunit ribosomal protein S16
MLMIRLQRIGKHKKPLYRLVINEKHKNPKGNVLEILGHYNPHTKKLGVKNERIHYWLSVGAQCSATVNNLFISKDIIKGEKVKSWRPKKKKGGEDKKAKEKKEA